MDLPPDHGLGPHHPVEGFGVDVVAMGLAPEPRPELDDYLRTALARVVTGGELQSTALPPAGLSRLPGGLARG